MAGTLSFYRHFINLRDPRKQGRSPYRLLDVVFMALCATIAGADNWVQIELFCRERVDWLARYCRLPQGEDGRLLTPSHDTFERLFKRLDPRAFGRYFGNWTAALADALGLKHVAIDGKTLRGSGDEGQGLRALHLVSAWSTANHLSLACLAVDDKSNEITAIPKLLRLLALEGALVTIDAMGTQKAIAEEVIAGGADYVLPVKGNQPTLLDDVTATFDAAAEQDIDGMEHDACSDRDSRHGRVVERDFLVLYDLELIRERALWPNLACVGLCISTRWVDGQPTHEERYYISSRPLTAQQLAEACRKHWGIENNLHWQLDVAFAEDGNQVADRHAAVNLSLLRRTALALLERHPRKASIASKRYIASMNCDFLQHVLQVG